jgi:lanosterol synthase
MTKATGREEEAPLLRKRGADDQHAPPKRPKLEAKTDITRWRLKDDDSRHTWHYLEDEKAASEWPQSYAEKYYLNLPLVHISYPPLIPGAVGLTIFSFP